MVSIGISDIFSWIVKVGDGMSWITQKIIVWLSTLGLNISSTSAKIINILVYLLLIYLIINLASSLKKPLKYGIVAIIIFLAISTGISLIV